MKKIVSLVAGLSLANSTFGTVIFQDAFSYADGNLVGQGGWAQTGAVATSPVQVTGGRAFLGSTGQDVYRATTPPTTLVNGTSFYIGLNFSVSAAQAGGDYFLHWTPNPGNASIFQERIFIRANGGGFVLGAAGSSTPGPFYGSTTLSLNTEYRLVVNYASIAGNTNDTMTLYLNPTDPVEGNNAAYLISPYSATGAETNLVGALNLRQGSASTAPTLSVDDLIAATTFGEALAIPEPSVFALAGIGLLGWRIVLRRRR